MIQLLTVVFSIFCAYLNEVPVIKMINNGASIKEEQDFHRANFLVKFVYALAVTYASVGFQWKALILFIQIGFIQWLVFDIALNLILQKVWDYIGDTASIDRKLNKWIPNGYAGEVKAVVSLAIIILLNIIYYGNLFK